MKYFLSFCLLLFLQTNLSAQNFAVTGTVVDASTKLPLTGVNVFINNTTKFSVTNDSGRFKITDITDENFEVVCAIKGYETINYLYKVSPRNYSIRFEVVKTKKEKQVSDSALKINRRTWETTFLNDLLGDAAAPNCEVTNMEALRFYHIDSIKELHVYLTEPLIIFNEALGFMMQCSFNDFGFDYSRNGDNKIFTWYKPLTSKSPTVILRWIKEREMVYENSILRFMRALYVDSLMQQGFQIKFITRIHRTDSDFNRIGTIMKETNTEVCDLGNAVPGTKKNYIDLIDKKQIPSSRFRNADSVVSFELHNKILYVFNSKGSKKYENNSMLIAPISFLSIGGNQKIIIEPSGAFYDPTDVVLSGYWSNQKLGSLLPTDY